MWKGAALPMVLSLGGRNRLPISQTNEPVSCLSAAGDAEETAQGNEGSFPSCFAYRGLPPSHGTSGARQTVVLGLPVPPSSATTLYK